MSETQEKAVISETETASLIGKIVACKEGGVGIVVGKRQVKWGEVWVVEKFDDGEEWLVKNPRIIANSLEKYNEVFLEEFGT